MWTQVLIEEASAGLRERARLAQELGILCGLPGGVTAEECRGQQDCVFFDVERDRCALLVWDVPSRIGSEGIRWFVSHRNFPVGVTEGLDEALAARCASL